MTITGTNHPNVEYHEIDLSEYNLNADTYDELASELGIDLKMLYDAPIVFVVYQDSGDAFTTDKGSLALSKVCGRINYDLYFDTNSGNNLRYRWLIGIFTKLKRNYMVKQGNYEIWKA